MCIPLLDARRVAARMKSEMNSMTNCRSGWSMALLALGLVHCGSDDDVRAADARPDNPAGPPATTDGEPPIVETTLGPIDDPRGDTRAAGRRATTAARSG